MFAILIIESDETVSANLDDWLSKDGYKVKTCRTAASAVGELQNYAYDLLILSSTLSDGSGIELCKRLSSSNLRLPMLMIGASIIDETVSALDAGAQDFVAKPLPLDELSARVRSLLRRYASKGVPRAMIPAFPAAQVSPVIPS